MISKDTLEYAVANQKKKITMQDAGLSRFLLPSLPDAASHALIISGVRRCGKSTLLLQMLKKQKQKQFYLNLDDPLLFDFDISDFQVIDQIIKEKKAQFLFFDEPQIVKGWEIYIKQKLEEKYRVFVTGSNASLLSRELGTRLTGRHITKELFPFSYQEFVKFEKVKTGIESFQKYIDLGGFPEYLKNQNSDILSLLFDDILNRDIIIRYGVRDAHSLKKLALYLVDNCANLVSARKLAPLLNIAVSTLLEYFSYLEDTYLINFIPKFSYSLKAQLVNPKKTYCIDNGLIKTLSTSFTKDYGRVLENAVYCHLRRKSKEIYYFNEDNAECDFVSCQNGAPVELVQVCYDFNRETMAREQKGLKEAMNFFKISNAKIITYNQSDMYIQDGKKIQVIPSWKYMSQE